MNLNFKPKYLFILLIFSFISCKKQDISTSTFKVLNINVGAISLDLFQPTSNNAVGISDQITISFNNALDPNTLQGAIELESLGIKQDFTYTLIDPVSISIQLKSSLIQSTKYTIRIKSSLRNTKGENLPEYSFLFTTSSASLQITSLKISDQEVLNKTKIKDVDLNANFKIRFNYPLNPNTITSNTFKIFSATETINSQLLLSDSNRLVTILPSQALKQVSKYFIAVSSLVQSSDNISFGGFSTSFFTTIDTINKFPLISDNALLDKVEMQTFKYFWDFGHPVSGLARERNTSGDIVTIGGSGFGLMSIIVGIERNFITRAEGIARFEKIINFLKNADRFHGAYPHWMNGSSGKTIPFSDNDNGADLVETSYLMQGLLTVRAYLNANDTKESSIISSINEIWNGVEWDWFTRGNQKVLFWHWSPNKGWAMNIQIKGWNECLITYFLAAASPSHSIQSDVYNNGWASNGSFSNGNSYFNIKLPLGEAYGGPLFFSHYSFLGLDPTNLSDQYANYWQQNTNHSKINNAYCIANPKGYPLYGENCWGLTASDNSNGYSAHSPTNDLGVISPTAAISSMPYTPDASMKALKFFYYKLGDKIWKDYGFVDAFDISNGWFASSFLAIDQGPIIVMIENYRTQLLWNLFMSNPEVGIAKNKLGFN